MPSSRTNPPSELAAVAELAQGCRNCPLWEHATQTVFGEGPVPAEVMLVGEQPGDREDVEGHPFVGPAGRLLSDALDEAGLDRATIYVTNAVKHFKWQPRGKRRIHQKPNETEISACRPWLDHELALVHPRLLVALGATAGQALYGKSFRVTRQRGQLVESDLAELATATVHPSSVLRAPDEEARRAAYSELVDDLRGVAAHLTA
jgi:uracil-DNA glycosylase